MAKAAAPGLLLLWITNQLGLCKSWAATCKCSTRANNSQATTQRAECEPTTQNSNGTQQTQQEPAAPEVFNAQKAAKAKIEEGSSGEGIKPFKPFCFRCYKPGHGKLECKVKLFCDICASTEHLTRRCPILK
jgi:hypothetical protein